MSKWLGNSRRTKCPVSDTPPYDTRVLPDAQASHVPMVPATHLPTLLRLVSLGGTGFEPAVSLFHVTVPVRRRPLTSDAGKSAA